MSRIMQPVVACFRKEKQKDEEKKQVTQDDSSMNATESTGLVSKVSSSLYNVGAGAVGLGVGGIKGIVGLGVGGVKWAANTTYTVGSQALGTSSKVLLRTKTKDKNE